VEFRELAVLAGLCRERLRSIEVVPIPLRTVPTVAERIVLERSRGQVRQAYRAGGADLALALLRESPWMEVVATYPEWYRKTERLPSRREFLAKYLKAATPGDGDERPANDEIAEAK
jgi:hypothetical protein